MWPALDFLYRDWSLTSPIQCASVKLVRNVKTSRVRLVNSAHDDLSQDAGRERRDRASWNWISDPAWRFFEACGAASRLTARLGRPRGEGDRLHAMASRKAMRFASLAGI